MILHRKQALEWAESPAVMRKIILALLLVAVSADAADREPVFPYGAVYFRKSNPPQEDWAQDHKTAA